MNAEHDNPYGLTPDERAEFEKIFDWGCDDKDDSGRYTGRDSDLMAKAWAACAKLNRDRLEERHGAVIYWQQRAIKAEEALSAAERPWWRLAQASQRGQAASQD